MATKYGESHGRNLLTKDAEDNDKAYYVNGFDNPYCRVWTHHYQYDRLSKTMRANMSGINRWEGFEWTDEEKKLLFPEVKDTTDMSDENYIYAWRGEHNQSRRERFSALDTASGLVKIAPKFLGGGKSNIHTKDCMFSIENLAWKDYDPYSFTQALSWEQRGPMGGRIMWFPPYGLTFNETATANWNASDFIGRGEKLYTYVNSERSGNLSFIMLTDHPSSIDYSSWWDNDEDKENDYHRYFAGCMGGINEEATLAKRASGEIGQNESIWNEDNIHEAPPYLTDEFLEPEVSGSVSADGNPSPPEPTWPEPDSDVEDNNPTTVEFFVFFPNNYSGVNDAPTVKGADVDSMAYLMFGRGAMRKTESGGKSHDILIDGDGTVTDDYTSYRPGYWSDGYGYEIRNNTPITPTDANDTYYIQGGKYMVCGTENGKYSPEPAKKWRYRIDFTTDSKGNYQGGEQGYRNTICQKLSPNTNYSDTKSYGLNSDTSALDGLANKENFVCSYAEVACALHKVLGHDSAYKYIYNLVLASSQESKTRVEKLLKLFDGSELKTVTCNGMSNSHGSASSCGTDRNRALARNRANTVMAWLRGYEKWSGISNASTTDGIEEVGKEVDNRDVNTLEAKKYRCAHCVMEFAAAEKEPANEAEPLPKLNENEDFSPIELLDTETVYQTQTIGQIVDTSDKTVHYVKFVMTGSYMNLDKSTGVYDMSATVKDWTASSAYSEGEVVRYNGFYYKVKHDIQGKIPSAGNPSEYIEFPNFVPLTESEVASLKANGIIEPSTKGEFYRKNSTKLIYGNETKEYDEWNCEIQTDPKTECSEIWVRPEGSDSLVTVCGYQLASVKPVGDGNIQIQGAQNKLRYDQEYYFYRQYFADHPMVFDKLQEKIRYFNPVFHSMTPEGFNARLTFLHQCTRQGMTKTMGDLGGKTANNLAFGRPPYCVLRLGDFYNQMIVIDNITFDYSISDGISWDLNTEGNGVQPMLCKVNISFKFIGGGDIAGPVRRLQNAMTFNYYANTSFYDNRADRVVYDGDNYATMGGAGNNVLNLKKSYAYTPKVTDDRRW